MKRNSTYDRVVRRLVILFVLVAACSSGGKKASPPTTVATTSTTVTSVATTTSTTSTSTTTVPPVVSAAKIANLSGPSSVSCNAPTSVELKWTTTGAAKVELHIDGAVFARYPDGAQDQLEPLTCDGKSHTYTIVATDANGVAASKSLTISTRRP